MTDQYHSKTKPLEIQTSKHTVFQFVQFSNVRSSSPHCKSLVSGSPLNKFLMFSIKSFLKFGFGFQDTMRLVRRLHEEILETSDVKILESAIQNQSALTAKSVVETLRGDGSFSKSATG